MQVRRIVPNIGSHRMEESREFYCGLLGLRVGMDMGWIATYVSPSNPTAQISIALAASDAPAPAAGAASGPSPFSISVEVEDVDGVHREAVARGCRIVYPLTDEPWGVRRFAVEDPNGVVINVM